MFNAMCAGAVQEVYAGNNFTRVTLYYQKYCGTERGRESRFVDFVFFGPAAESLANVRKGATLAVTCDDVPGSRDIRIFTPREGGDPQGKVSFVGRTWEYVGRREEAEPDGDAVSDEVDPDEEEAPAPPARSAAPARGNQAPSRNSRPVVNEDQEEDYVNPFEKDEHPRSAHSAPGNSRPSAPSGGGQSGGARPPRRSRG